MVDAPAASCGRQIDAQVGHFFIAALETDIAGTAEIDAQRSVRREGEFASRARPVEEVVDARFELADRASAFTLPAITS
ncbi:hypothetical protein [Rhizobium mongolense]|uniref:Uncharacterized protein n=1 Tax=Rhizobium mongolense TaxID=57676 RepID=A0A7W6RPG5_9HYPH|nr:hypothetical protein [Rhizobium mongolense]MBB4226289.1 hypothetical protein [Rhizobium mongolense]MBB4276253.1 hypothetical protein [Rhizobium mongolense]